MIRKKPHYVDVYVASESVSGSDYSVAAPTFAAGYTIQCQLTAKTPGVTFQNWGLELNRPHVILADTSTLAYWTHGNQVRLRSGEGLSESLSLTITAASGGTYTISYDGQTTATINYNATSTTVAQKLGALSNLSTATITGSGTVYPYTISIGGTLAGFNLKRMTINTGSLTGTGASGTLTSTPTDRWFVVQAMKKHFAGGNADHITVLLEELEYGY